jgi:RimJ/RimL family protein N-acetyltransferase
VIPSELTLRDGSTVEVRPIRPDDADGLRGAFERLSEESRYRRFFVPMPVLGDKLVRYLTEVDHHDHEALLAIDIATGDGVGVARYVRLGGSDRAEAAVTVVDDWHGRGLGTLLLEALAVRAREEGVGRFVAVMLAENEEMRHVLEGMGEPIVTRRDGTEVEVEIELPEDGVGPHLKALLQAAAARPEGPAAVPRR